MEENLTEKELWLWYAILIEQKNGVTNNSFKNTEQIEHLYKSDIERLTKIYGYTEKEAKLIEKSKDKAAIDKYIYIMKEKDIKLVTLEDDKYPLRLRYYRDSPGFLFYRGSLPREYLPTVGMVGARACSNYGRNMAKSVGRELSSNNIQIISGLARGIDTYSLIGGVEGGTPTYAVLGCGVDICYPSENIELYEDILNGGGGVISEYLPGARPIPWHFPLRNRIISGLSDQIAVIEAREKSGSLITVEYGLEQGKDIWAVPGRVGDTLSSGCNRLLKSGAGVLTSGYDILCELQGRMKDISLLKKKNEDSLDTIDEREVKVYAAIESYPVNINTIMERTQIEYTDLIEILLKLQLDGIVEEVGKNFYVRNSK